MAGVPNVSGSSFIRDNQITGGGVGLGLGQNLGTSRANSIGSNPADKIEARNGDKIVKNVTFPPDLGKYRFNIIEASINSGIEINTNLNSVLSFEKMYVLPLPFGLTEHHTTQYEQNFNFLQAGLTAVGSILPNATGAGGQLGGALASAGGAVTGLALNQFKAVTLKSPNFNQHKFAWKFSAKNAAESRTIREIVYGLKTGMLPSLYKEDSRAILAFPKVYLMFFAPNLQFMYKLKPCVLQDLQIDYQGNNPAPAFFENDGGVTEDDFGEAPVFRSGNQSVQSATSRNAPESIVIHTTWLELEVWTQEDFKDKMESSDPFDGYSWYKGR